MKATSVQIRANRAKRAAHRNSHSVDDQTALADLLGDLMHFADTIGPDAWATALHSAEGYHETDHEEDEDEVSA